MPKVGIEPIRRRQLIDATLQCIESHGFQGATIIRISQLAGLSSGIISHYFGGKQGVIEAAVRHLLEQLRQGLLAAVSKKTVTPHQRLNHIVAVNFSGFQQSSPAIRTWLCFWARAVHEPGLARLQAVNSRRLLSNLLYSYRQLIPNRQQAMDAARMTAAMIDGFWLRSTLSSASEADFRQAERLCRHFIEQQIQQYGEV
ncbi:transcriptional regulator BetI [Kistimonas asteriae]|uniref:transcriptional regulator BetI n=1 Tax=Kistimonas asteriae TaxID=517724 RepID=UPI001BACC5B6|nr:transcriptional regulator BetI [Kistimonas asteriae]